MQDIEHVEDTQDSYDIFENDIDMALNDFCIMQKIENIKQETQSVWNACLLHIYKICFKNTKRLKCNNYTSGNLKYGNHSNNNAYDIDKVNSICDIYINICYMYDKEISIMGFCKLTGINPDTIYDWGLREQRISSSACDVYKKLMSEREESLSSMLVGGKRNPVGLLGVLNHAYNWNMPGVRDNRQDQKKSIEQIEAEHNLTDRSQEIKAIQAPKADF